MNKKKIIRIVAVSAAGLVVLLALFAPFFASSRSRKTSDPVAVHNSELNGSSNMAASRSNASYAAETAAVAAEDYYFDPSYDAIDEFGGDYYYEDSEYYSSAEVSPDGSFTELSTSEATPAKLIRTMTMTVETVNFEQVDTDIRTRMNQLGGYFEDSTVSGTGNVNDARRGYYVIRIPADKLDEFVSYFGSSCTVISQSESTRDVTLEYVDTESRISSLRTEMEVLNGMLENAEDLDTLIMLQSRITEIRYQIENYESQLRAVDNQVDYSTLTLNVNEVTIETEPEPIQEYTFGEKVSKAYNEGLEDLKVKMQDMTISFCYAAPDMIARLIVLAVIALLIFVIYLIVRACIRRSKAKRAKKTSPETPENTTADKKPE